MEWRSKNTKNKDLQKGREKVHAFTFIKVCEVIDKDILIDKKIIKLSDLISLYVSRLQETEFANQKLTSLALESL